MQNRVPTPRAERPPLPDFAPVPRKYRHDGWTPERQKAFIEALADTGCVSRAAGQVNMAQANCYTLRRAAGAEVAGVNHAPHGLGSSGGRSDPTLVPVFVAGRLMGFRRKRNDALLMFCLRHYGQDANGKRTTINYFSSRASAGAVAGEGQAGVGSEASTTTVRTVISGAGDRGEGAARDDAAAGAVSGFAGVPLDAEAEAAIAAALEACAARAREAQAAYDVGGETAADAGENDPSQNFVPSALLYRGQLEPPFRLEDASGFTPEEDHWRDAGEEMEPELARIRDEIEAKQTIPGAGNMPSRSRRVTCSP